MAITRRDVLKLAGGSFLGMLFTPVPWKLVDDTAIWTQNWSLMPPVPRGPITIKYSTCTLCSGGCALKARCVNGSSFALAGVRNHPINHGILCPMGLAAHHLPYHPLRLHEPCKFSGKKNDSKLAAMSLDDIITEISADMHDNAGAVAILDQRPGRMISVQYQQFLAGCSNGMYLLPPLQEASTLHEIRRMSDSQLNESGFDFENTRVILSFGAPLLDGWGTPGRMMHLFNKRAETRLQFIQVESNQSRTALQADTWLPVKPGAEAVLAMGIANVILQEELHPAFVKKTVTDFEEFKGQAAQFSPQYVAEKCGIQVKQIIKTAHAVAGNPSIILSGCDAGGGPLDKEAETAIAGLNILLGNVGRKGGIVSRNELPGTASGIQPRSIAYVPDHSIRVLIVDGAESGYAIPWSLVERKLAPEKGIIVSLSPYMTPLSAHADYLVPSPAQFESLEEVATPGTASVASFSLSMPLNRKSEKSVEPIMFLQELAEATGMADLHFTSTEKMLKQRVEAIYASKRGNIFFASDGNSKNLADVSSADEFWTVLTEGGYWIDDESSQKSNQKFKILRSDIQLNVPIPEEQTNTLTLIPSGLKGTTAAASISPIMSKVFQESNLRDISGRVALNPLTAAGQGVENGSKATLRTERGELNVVVYTDASVMPGVISAAVGPSPNKSETLEQTNGDGILALCALTDDGTWRLTQATIAQS